ncbi:MAG: response regulator, partial [Aurantimicrobium sp.]
MTKILLVEDEVALSEPLAFLLDKEGYEIIVAEDGTAALELFASHSPDLILLD